jgi:serine/threonine protein kinase
MASPTTNDDFLQLVRKSGVLEDKRLDTHLERLRAAGALPGEPGKLAGVLVRDGLLTHFQAEQILQGKWRRFTIGRYKVLERLGTGGMGSVYLCEHKVMRRRVAVKVLPTAKAEDPAALERFYREARAVAALDHPNLVRAFDIDQEDNLHFLVLEYVEGASLHELVKRSGPLDVLRACHYIRQAAVALQHAHEAGLVHRDIKPGNVLVDRSGTVKVFDLGLARFFNDEEDNLTQKYDENVLGTADYLAPEQALDSHGVDIRADLYSLGATFYYTLTGRPPFAEGTVAQKLIWHQTRQPKPIRALRPEVPEAVVAIVDKMMAKEPAQRYQSPAEVVEALAPWTQTPIPPPAEAEMPQLCPAARGSGPELSAGSSGSSPAHKTWKVQTAPSSKPTTPAPTGPRPPAPPSAVQPPGPAPTIKIRAAPVPVAAPGADEGESPWEGLAADTANLTASADTDPRSVRKAPGSSRPRLDRPSASAFALDPRRVWWVVAVVSLLVSAALGVVAWWAFGGPRRPRAAQAPSAGPAILSVSRSGRDHAFPSVRAALLQARSGDHIVVLDETVQEPLHLEDGKLGREVTVWAAVQDRSVVWRAPADLPKGVPLFHLANTPGFRLKGFTLDGAHRVDHLMVVAGTCPGLTLENLSLQGFNRTALAVWNCAGDQDNRVSITQVHMLADQPAEAALAFHANPKVLPPHNQHLLVRDCLFEGPFRAPITGTETLVQVKFEGNLAQAGPDQPQQRVPVER